MGLGVEIRVNDRQLARFLAELSQREIPFAMSLAMNLAGKEAVELVRREVPGRFTIRQQAVLRGFRHNPTHKRDWPNLRVEVGTVDRFWVLHETGGTKRPESGSNLAIPTRRLRRTAGGKIPKALRPRPLISAGKARKAEDAIRLVVKRRSADRRTMVYLLRQSARIQARLRLEEMVRGSVQRYFPLAFEKAFQHTLKTSRDRALKVRD